MTITSAQLYEKIVAAGIQHDSHESDLYIPVTPETTKLVSEYEFRTNVQRFTSQIDGKPWYDIPFAYQPAWEKRRAYKA